MRHPDSPPAVVRFPRASRRALAALAALAALVLGACGCSWAGSYVWARDASDADFTVRRTGEYVIEPGDVLSVRVVGQDSLTVRARVGPDGTIALPLAGTMPAERRTPSTLAKELAKRLQTYMVAPSVSVTVDEVRPVSVTVVGEVAHPGVYVVALDASVLSAIAAAGGTTEYADRGAIYVVRVLPKRTVRIRFTYERLTRGVLPDAAFALRPGDAVVVE